MTVTKWYISCPICSLLLCTPKHDYPLIWWTWLPKHRRQSKTLLEKPTYNVCMCLDCARAWPWSMRACVSVSFNILVWASPCGSCTRCRFTFYAAAYLMPCLPLLWPAQAQPRPSPGCTLWLGPFLSMIYNPAFSYSSATASSPHSCSLCISFHADTNRHIHRHAPTRSHTRTLTHD